MSQASTRLEDLWLYKGVPVPYIARWSSEVVRPGPAMIPVPVPQGYYLTYKDEQPEDRVEGQLWLRERDSPGHGEPMFADVHSHRQRLCQIEGRCQICGQVQEPPLRWLIPDGLYTREQGTLITDVAPVCELCQPWAERYCPFIQGHRFAVYTVKGYRPYALWGDIAESAGPTRVPSSGQLRGFSKVRHVQGQRLLSGYTGDVMARQMVVQLWDWRRHRR
jgi:hypothetical protein